MGFRLALVPLAVLLLVPLAHATPPPGTGTISLTVGAIKGLVKQDGKDVLPYKGNVTVAATVTFDCSLLAYEFANKQGNDIDHFHVQPADDKLPPWLVADELITHFAPPAPGAPAFPVPECASGTGTYTQTVDYPFAVTAAAPAIAPQVLNLTANLGDDAFADPAAVHFTVQFHANYTVEPSIRFPYAVTGKSANFTVSIHQMSNAPAMIMFNNVQATAGAITGLAMVTLSPGQSTTFPVTFTPAAGCWTTATVTGTTTVQGMGGGDMAGMPGMTGMAMGGPTGQPQPFAWTFTHGPCSSTPATGTTTTSKKSAMPALLPLVGLAVALLAFRRRD